ncbi:MAG: hypothetical protein ABI584_00135 [Acidobacteriota bacterium]
MNAALDTVGEKLRLALELFESGERRMRQNLRRRFPSASTDEIEEKLVEWLRKRPNAAPDADGRPSHRSAVAP